jgi:N6-L-threonylcarbamoyladenine synthase
MDTVPKVILGIETSCDDTALGMVSLDGQIIAQLTYHQWAEHAPFGGVVPRLAAHTHQEKLPLLWKHLLEAHPNVHLEAIAVTVGPGLVGGLMMGALFAQVMGLRLGVPVVPIHHLEAHALSPRIKESVPFPYLLLLVSGGHTQWILVQDLEDYILLGSTRDDALGECFDKVGRLLGLPYPGGPQIEKKAQQGDPHRFSFPKPLYGSSDCSFSFSGLKTAALNQLRQSPFPTEQDQNDFCAGFQRTIGDILCERFIRVLQHLPNGAAIQHLVIAGGVAANRYLYHRLKESAESQGLSCVTPPLSLCTDNGVMIAWAALERWKRYQHFSNPNLMIRARWPLSELKPLPF